MDEPFKESNKIITDQCERTPRLHSIRIKQSLHDKNSHVQYLRYQKGSTELSTLCTTKFSSLSESRIYIGILIFNKRVQLESLCAAVGWKNSFKLAEFCQLVKTLLN